jgi:hypothetical protein
MDLSDDSSMRGQVTKTNVGCGPCQRCSASIRETKCRVSPVTTGETQTESQKEMLQIGCVRPALARSNATHRGSDG